MYPYVPWPALLIKNNEKILVIGDLHLGYETSLAESGINLPSQTVKIIRNLKSMLEKLHPDRLVILGDFKHSIPKISSQEWKDIPLFLDEISKKVPVIDIVPGNHDGKLATFSFPKVNITSGRGILIEDGYKIGLFHGHSWPSPKIFKAKILVVCHNHPAIQFKTFFNFRIIKSVWLKVPVHRSKLIKSFLKSRHVKLDGKNPLKTMTSVYGISAKCSQLIIMPAFNELLGGLPFNVHDREKFLGPILRSDGVLLDEAEVFMLDGSYLGLLKDLKWR